MIAYLTEEKKCRSRLLLYYFGEKSDHNCGQCDVCLAQNKKQALSKEKQLAYQELIVQLIDESPTPVMLRDVLRKWPELNHVQFNELITKMRHKNIIELRDGCLFNEIDNK